MKRILLGAAIAINAIVASAQPVPSAEAPRHKCEPKPEYPGRLGMTIESRRKQFDRDVKTYRDCMTAFVDERKAALKANESAAQAAIDEYNAHMKKLKDEQEAAKQ